MLSTWRACIIRHLIGVTELSLEDRQGILLEASHRAEIDRPDLPTPKGYRGESLTAVM